MTQAARRNFVQCESCFEPGVANLKLSVTTLDGEVLDTAVVCPDCATSAKVVDLLRVPVPVDEPASVS